MIKKLLLTAPFLLALVLVRVFENDMFYDPFIKYFHSSAYHTQGNFPEFSWLKHLFSIAFRYSINTILSLIIIFLLFRDKQTLSFSAVLFLIQFLLLIIVYSIMLGNEFAWGYLSAFYVRRFLLQPILLILLVPALFYQKNVVKN